MIRCIVVDDEAGAIDLLRDYISHTPQLTFVDSFRDAVEALDYLRRNPVDLVFLDINMPRLDGLQLSSLIRTSGVMVIFCTAYPEYAPESYEHDAVDYLMKPVSFERFLKAVSKAEARGSRSPTPSEEFQASKDRLFIKSGNRIHQLDMSELLYMKKDSHYIEFHTRGSELLSRMNMEELLATLPPGRFARIHKSYVIALDKIETIERDFVVIKGKELPIGDSFRADFFKRIRFAGK